MDRLWWTAGASGTMIISAKSVLVADFEVFMMSLGIKFR